MVRVESKAKNENKWQFVENCHNLETAKAVTLRLSEADPGTVFRLSIPGYPYVWLIGHWQDSKLEQFMRVKVG
jgi:hypothetical protein